MEFVCGACDRTDLEPDDAWWDGWIDVEGDQCFQIIDNPLLYEPRGTRRELFFGGLKDDPRRARDVIEHRECPGDSDGDGRMCIMPARVHDPVDL